MENEFKTDDYVTIHSTNSPLDGRMGTILGLSTNLIVQTYIVGLDKTFEHEGFLYRAVTIPGSCLCRA